MAELTARIALKEGILIRVIGGECYQISGEIIGEGGGSIVYPARKMTLRDGKYVPGQLSYALKESYPFVSEMNGTGYTRLESGKIVPVTDDSDSRDYFSQIKNMQLEEEEITSNIYRKGFRLIPILGAHERVEISFDEGETFNEIPNAFTVMESLESKGKALGQYIREYRSLSSAMAFSTAEQILMAVKEVHDAGYIHLDLGDGNIFVKGSLEDNSGLVSLIDFGSARKLENDNLCAEVSRDRLFSTPGFSAPEMRDRLKDSVRLGPEADIYSIGCILLYMLTGRKYPARELDGKPIDRILTGARMRKIDCPTHLEPKLKSIIARAIQMNPEDRYHSCAEMLEEVSDFADALSPYRSDLNQVEYDAFISYKHNEVDSHVARLIQEKLEHLKASSTDGKKIKRVFLDEGELASCADMGAVIRDALKNSGWLIVICSKETRNSKWVNEEIDYFLETHDKNRVLAVMTEGEPEEVFPFQLLDEEGRAEKQLAADARGTDIKEIDKKVKQDAVLKLAAPMLGVTFDSLKQRHKTYLMKRIAVAACAAFVLMGGFAVYTIFQNAKINEQYQAARQNQARFLSDKSLELYKQGKVTDALMVALALESDKADKNGYIVPEQMYPLNVALNSYSSNRVINYKPVMNIDRKNVKSFAFTNNNKYIAVVNDKEYGYIYNSNSGEQIWTLNEETIEGGVKCFSAYEDDQLFVLSNFDCYYIADPKKKEIVIANETKDLFDGESEKNFTVFKNKLIYLDAMDELVVQEIDSGKILLEMPLPTHNAQIYAENLVYNEEANAVAFACKSVDNEHNINGVYICDLTHKSVKKLTDKMAYQVCFADKNRVGVIERPENDGPGDLSIYDIESGEIVRQVEEVWDKENILIDQYYRASGLLMTNLITDYLPDGGPFLVGWVGNTLVGVDLEADHGTYFAFSGDSYIKAVGKVTKQSLIAVREDGSISLANFEMAASADVSEETIDTNMAYYMESDQTAFAFGNNEIIKLEMINDDQLEYEDLHEYISENDVVKALDYYNCGDKIYRCISMFDSHTDATKRLISLQGKEDDIKVITSTSLNPMQFVRHGGTDYAIYIDNLDYMWSEAKLVVYDLNKGSKYKEFDITNINSLEGRFYLSDDGTRAYYLGNIDDENTVQYNVCQIDIFNDSNDAIKPITDYYNCSNLVALEGGILFFKIEATPQYVDVDLEDMSVTPIASEEDQSIQEDQYVRMDPKGNKITPVKSIDSTSDYGDDFAVGNVKPLLAYATYDGIINVVDINKDKVIASFELDGYENMSFCDNDEKIITKAGDQLAIYDIKAQDFVARYIDESFSDPYNTKLICDNDSDYFVLVIGSIMGSNTTLFYIRPEDTQIVKYASIEKGNVCLASGEVALLGTDYLGLSRIYDYKYLRKKGLEKLNGRTLTDEQKRKYYISE